MILASNLSLEGGAVILTWDFLATKWTTAPSEAGTTAAGTVYAYTLGGVTRYRLVPTTYSAAQDAFYGGFSGGTLFDPICSRGGQIAPQNSVKFGTEYAVFGTEPIVFGA